MSNDRCGYTHHTNRYPGRGAISCWRPTHEEHDRCIWHVDETAKPPEAFEELRPSADERLDGAILRGMALNDQEWLRGTTLIGADFERANLDRANLERADLKAARFDEAHAKGANFDGASLEDASFDSTKLQGASFEDTWLKDTEFSGSRVGRRTTFDDVTLYEEKLEETDDPSEQEAYFDAATWVYRQIEDISRRNALFRNAETYFYREKDLRRRFAWLQGNYVQAIRAEGSKHVTGYGRNPWRIVTVSGLVVGLSALLYPVVGKLRDTAGPVPTTHTLSAPLESPLSESLAVFGKSLYLSVITFATLGSGDVQPVGAFSRALAGVESLLGFALIALLISVLLGRGNWL